MSLNVASLAYCAFTCGHDSRSKKFFPQRVLRLWAHPGCGCPITEGAQGQAGWELGSLGWWEMSLPIARGWNQVVI